MIRRGPTVRIRLATSRDGAAVDQVIAQLFPASQGLCYLAPIELLTANMRRALLDVDGDRHVLLVAEVGPRRSPRTVGLARYVVDGQPRTTRPR